MNINNLSAITILKMGFLKIMFLYKNEGFKFQHKNVPFCLKFVYNNGNRYYLTILCS